MKSALFALSLLTIALSACASSTAPKPGPSSAELRQQITTQIADAGCDSSQQCHTLAMGAKACGGPESYVAWSDKFTDGERLRQLGEHYAVARRFENERSGLMSNCVLTPDPGAVCRASHCVLQAPAPGSSNPPVQ